MKQARRESRLPALESAWRPKNLTIRRWHLLDKSNPYNPVLIPGSWKAAGARVMSNSGVCRCSLLGGLSQQQLPGQVRAAAAGQALRQLTGLGRLRGSRQAPPPHSQGLEGLGGHAVAATQLHQLGGAAAEPQGEQQEGKLLLRELLGQPEQERVRQEVCWVEGTRSHWLLESSLFCFKWLSYKLDEWCRMLNRTFVEVKPQKWCVLNTYFRILIFDLILSECVLI